MRPALFHNFTCKKKFGDVNTLRQFTQLCVFSFSLLVYVSEINGIKNVQCVVLWPAIVLSTAMFSADDSIKKKKTFAHTLWRVR